MIVEVTQQKLLLNRTYTEKKPKPKYDFRAWSRLKKIGKHLMKLSCWLTRLIARAELGRNLTSENGQDKICLI